MVGRGLHCCKTIVRVGRVAGWSIGGTPAVPSLVVCGELGVGEHFSGHRMVQFGLTTSTSSSFHLGILSSTSDWSRELRSHQSTWSPVCERPVKKKTFSATDIHWDPHSHTQPYPAIPTILSHTQPHSAILSDTQAYSAIPSHTQLYSAIPSHTQSYSAIYSHTHTQPFVAIPSHLSIFSHLQLYSAIAIHPPASYSSPCPATFTTSTTSQPSPIPNQAATSTAAISSMTKLSAFPADAALHQQQNRQIDPNTCDM